MRGTLLAGFALLAAAAHAQEAVVGGSNTVRWERYDTSGNALASPYPVSTSTGYDELALDFAWRASPYDLWRGFLTGVVNDSPYRSPERGVVPERIAVSRENGEAAIPYRLELGDFFAFTTARTQQRALKGAAVELQPGAPGGVRQSILLFAGAFQPDWRDLRWSADNSVGLSWLVEGRRGRAGVNVLRNARDARDGGGSREQEVASVTAEAPFGLGATRWRAAGELAALHGDHERIDARDDGRDKRDTGAFVELSGRERSNVLSWRLRGERYGADYRPFGAAVVPGRRSGEAHLAWSLPAALTLRVRAQDFRDGWESSDPLDTRVVGASLAGPLGIGGATLSADAFRRRLERADGTLDQAIVNGNAHVALPTPAGVAQLGLVLQDTDDRVFADASPRLRQASLGLTRPLAWGGWTGVVVPGIVWREVTGAAGATRDLGLSLALSAANGPHRFALTAGHLDQDPAAASSPDLATVNFAFEYRYRWGRHEFGVDYTAFDRRSTPGARTEAYRVGVQWTMYFDRAPVHVAAAVPVAVPDTGALPRDVGLVAAIAPGADLAAARERLAEAGLGGGSVQAGGVVYEARLLPDVDARQRLVLAGDGGRVDRTALVVSLAGVDANEAASTWSRVLRAMVERFGRPAATYEEGGFGPAYANDVLMGRLVRAADWRLADGVLRVGIPRRLDGTARIEIQHARALPAPRDGGWGTAIP